MWLWVLIITSIAVYVVDIFTAVNLLAFDQFAGVEPAIPFDISKWIFATCIILSFIFLGFEWFRAIGVIRRGSVAESYLDPLAVIVQSIRVDKNGHGYKRFLVFAELTKNKKGIVYAALFVYFQFKGELRAFFKIFFCFRNLTCAFRCSFSSDCRGSSYRHQCIYFIRCPRCQAYQGKG